MINENINSIPPQAPYYRIYLQALFKKRCQANEAYSLRAFARAVELSPSALSRVFAGKRHLSPEAAKKIAAKLSMNATDTALLVKSVIAERKQRSEVRILADDEVSIDRAAAEYEEKAFQASADLHHVAILELTFVDGFQSDPSWIAKALGIPRIEAKLAVERLEYLGLLKRDETGRLVRTAAQIRTTDRSRTTAAHKLYQEQILKAAVHSLKRDPIDTRSMTSMTMAIDPKKLPVAKAMIEEFMETLCKVLESGEKKQVYQLGVSLYALQKLEGQ